VTKVDHKFLLRVSMARAIRLRCPCFCLATPGAAVIAVTKFAIRGQSCSHADTPGEPLRAPDNDPTLIGLDSIGRSGRRAAGPPFPDL
jgi:hypothetical protein